MKNRKIRKNYNNKATHSFKRTSEKNIITPLHLGGEKQNISYGTRQQTKCRRKIINKLQFFLNIASFLTKTVHVLIAYHITPIRVKKL